MNNTPFTNRFLAQTDARHPIIQALMGWIARRALAGAVCKAEITAVATFGF
jgi:NAD(P)H-dependent flavin oxidoreductase YrpB (nitropropane dioxygenase family)